ncbi:MAG TPA: SgcJ/EcaC family oxidoreductase [Actinomycetota bacterium]|jgi:uncharacterized protein (TIGR02246 family)|nr:SgcJ/EcaC family oxidoreductase [Actinomycetota bacterium]
MTRANETAVQAVIDRVYAAWADNDADAFVAPYADDATAQLPGTYLKNRQAIRATMAALFSGELKGSRGIHEVQKIRFIGVDTAIAISKSAVLLAGEAEPSAESKYLDTWVLSERDETWRVEAYHACLESAG